MLKKVLESTTAGKLCPGEREVVEIPASHSVSEAFKTLMENDVLSAPVYDEEEHRYLGLLDMRDFVSWAVFLFDEQEAPSTDCLDVVNAAPRLFKAQFVAGINVKYLCKRNPFRAVTENSSLVEVARVLGLGVKRVPVLNPQGRVSCLISQATLNRFLHGNLRSLAKETDVPISAIGLGKFPVLSLPQGARAIDAFRLMDNKHISGVAVVDNSGCLVATTSSRDLKHFLRKPRRSLLVLPICEFLQKVRGNACPLTACGDAWQLDTCRPSDTLAVAMGKMSESNVHRIYVVNDAGVPTKVVALTDVMRHIARTYAD